MGEQSRDSEADEAASFNPFLRSAVEYDAAARLQMAEEIASARRLTVSPLLKDIITKPENFFQHCQQSTKMVENAEQRRFVSFNTKREAQIQLKRAEGLPLPTKIPMIEINPTRVTLSLEFESQYYPLMTNDYGDHENVASIMKQTNTLIQLPDQFSVGAPPDPFVQQVNITGFYSDVDRARKLMRENCHVSVYMSLSAMKISTPDLQKSVKENTIPNVEISFIETSSNGEGKPIYHLRFTSRVKREEDLVKAASEISKRAFESESPPEDLFSIHFTLSTFHVEHVVGLSSTKLLMEKLGVVAPQPDDYDRSFWHNFLDGCFFSFQMPCRGEAADTAFSTRRNRSASLTSHHSKRSRSNHKGRINAETEADHRSHSRAPSTSDSASRKDHIDQESAQREFSAASLVNIPFYSYPHPVVYHHQLEMMKAAQPGFQPAFYLPANVSYFNHPLAAFVRPEYLHMIPPEAIIPTTFQQGFSNQEIDHHSESTATTQRIQQSHRKHTSRGARTVSMSRHETSPVPRQPRVYEQVREDDARSSTRSASRRTSVSGEDMPFGNFDEKGYDRHFPRHSHPQQTTRFTKDESLRLKTGSRGDVQSKRLPLHRGTNQEFRGGGASDQLQFQTTHHLQLKTNEMDLEHERLFTQDNSQIEENLPSGNFEPQMMDGDFVQRLFSSASLNSPFERRSRAASCNLEKEEQSARFTDSSEFAYSSIDHPGSQQSRSIDNYRMRAVPVTKTMLEPRMRTERGLNKVNLEIRGKHFETSLMPLHHEHYPQNNVLFGTLYRIDPLKLIASVGLKEKLPRIHERQFNDVLMDKEKEMADAANKDVESTVVPEPSFEASSTMDLAFRSERSSENV
uniref:GLD-3 KH5 domain-containing protein n=1 Tax=Caenorhabditis japonica TaxID=281687 RepID=A0A8R1E450_CAEJA